MQPRQKLSNSQFLHLLNNGDARCLLHSLTLRKLYGGQMLQEIYEVFSRPATVGEAIDELSSDCPPDEVESVVSELTEKGLLVTDGEAELETYYRLFQRGMQQKNIQHMYFIPTTDCNFRCSYCFVEDDDRDFVPCFMELETARRGMDIFARLCEDADRISITFYGGEPLLNPEVVYDSMRYVRKLQQSGAFKAPVSMSMVTNGALIDKRTVDAVLETQTIVSISLDGPKVMNDAVRNGIDGRGTFAEAVRGYNLLKEAGADPGISCTLSQFNTVHIEQVAEFIAEELQPRGMGFNILLPQIDGGNPVAVGHEFAADQLISAFEILREYGIYEERMMRRVRPYVDSRFHLKDCMGVGGQIVITPDGRIGPCQAYLGIDEYFPFTVEELHARLDSLTSEDIYAHPLFDEWLHRFPLNMKECADCFAIAVCGGGCPYAAQVDAGSIWELDERICSQAKKIMQWMIWDTHQHLTAELIESAGAPAAAGSDSS